MNFHRIAARLCAAFAATLLATNATAQPSQRTIDDGYTGSQRYAAYKDRYAGIALPITRFREGQQVLFDRFYKKAGARALHADVFLPVGAVARHQGIVLIHGGGWRSGSKSHFYPLAKFLAQRGYTVILPEYRLSPEAIYPAGLIDINDALAWAKAHAQEFGFSPDRLALGGASAGAQMAALLAYSQDEALFKSNPSDDTSVNALLDIDSLLDFTTPLALHHENAAGSASSAATWLGGRCWRRRSAGTASATASSASRIRRMTSGCSSLT